VRVPGLGNYRRDWPAFAALILKCSGIGFIALKEQTSTDTIFAALLAARVSDTTLRPAPRELPATQHTAEEHSNSALPMVQVLGRRATSGTD
jgi:hypothetical protein